MFAKVIERLKCPSKFVDINDVSTRSEYWGTYLLLALPLGVLGGIFTSIVYFCDIDSEGVNKTFMVLGTCLSMLATLTMYPVFTRRIRDIGLPPWIALACIAPMFFPYVGGLTGIAMIVFGCIPGKAGAAEKCTTASCCTAMFWAASVVLFMFIGIRTMQGTIASIQEYKIEKAMEQLKSAFGSPSRSRSSSMFD